MRYRHFAKIAAVLTIGTGPCYSYEAPRADPGLYMIPDPLSKREFLVGGWGPGDTAKNFLRKYTPIFQDYLTEHVGPLYNPPISFKLIPTDWGSDETTTSHVLIEQGKLDFTCKDFIFDISATVQLTSFLLLL